MDDFNKVMLASRRQELQNLTKLLEEIRKGYPWIGDISLQGCGEESVVGMDMGTCLEVILNRVHVVLNMFVIYLENNGKHTQEIVGKNIVKPRSLTLAGIARTLWLKLVGWTGNVILKGQDDENIANQNVDQNRIKHCDSCIVAIKMVKTLLSKLDWNQSACSIASHNAHANIFNMEQVDSMSDFCKAICSDVNFLLQEIVTIKKDFLTTEAQLEIIKSDHSSLQKDHNECSIRHGRLLEERNKYNQMVTDLNLQVNELTTQLLELETTKLAQSEEIENLQRDTTNNQKLIRASAKIQADLARCNDDIGLFHEQITTESCYLTTKLQQFDTQLGELQGQVDKKVQLQQATIERLQSELDKDRTKTTEFKVTGDPIDDMMHQIQDNKRSILRLEEENCSLMKTIIRLRELK